MDQEIFQEESLEGGDNVQANGSSDGNGKRHCPRPADGGADDNGDEGVIPLSSAQLLAVKALRSGCSLWQAAKAAGVSRLTLHEWRARHPEFSKAMEGWEAGALSLARSRVAELAPLAADAMSDALAKENPRAAVALLRSIQVLHSFGATKRQAEGK